MFEKIYKFHCPRWEELPEEELFNKELVDYINDKLRWLYLGQDALTPTMVQNYSKWEVIPKISGRKYGRKQIACLMVVCVFKSVLDINEIKSGIELQLKLMDISASYNYFARLIEESLRRVFLYAFENKEIVLDKIQLNKGAEGLELVANAFSCQLLGRMIINNGGYKNLEE